MQPVYISPVSFDPCSPIYTVPCGAGMLSCLTGLTVDHWMNRIINFRNKNKRYKKEYTDLYTYKGTYWRDKHTLFFTEAMHFLKPYNPRKVVEFKKPPTLRSLMKKCPEDKTYVIWFKDDNFGGHTGIIHQKAYWDNDTEGATLNDFNVWLDYKVKYMVEITPKLHNKMIPLEEGEIEVTPSECSHILPSPIPMEHWPYAA